MEGNGQDHTISTTEQLEALYTDAPYGPAVFKETDRITPQYRKLIEAAPFAVLATCGPEGLDCSPRGDPPGFVRVVDEHTLVIPDRRGNNRIDSLRNLIYDPRLALLFLIPGVGETLRVNGRGAISIAPELLTRFPAQGKLPRSVIVVSVDRVYYQCPKALVRSELWNPARHLPRSALPSSGTILAALTDGAVGGAAYDAAYPKRLRETIY
jgi:uncharacterized protein